MRISWRADALAWLIVAAPLLATIGIASFAADIGRPFGHFTLTHNYTVDFWYLDPAPPWWPTLAGRGIVEWVGGQRVGADHWRTFAARYAANQPSLPVTREYWGDRYTTQVPVLPFSLGHYLELQTPFLVGGLSFWLLAVITYRRSPAALLNRTFAAWCALAAAYQWLFRSDLFPDADPLAPVLSFVFRVGLIPALGLAGVQLSTLLPAPVRLSPARAWFIPSVLLVATGVALAVSAGYAVSQVAYWNWGWSEMWVGRLDRWATLLGTGLLVAGPLAMPLRAAWHLVRPLGQRGQALALLGGWGVALPVLLPTGLSVLGVLDFSYYLSAWDMRYLYLGVPLAAAYVVLRYQTFRSVSLEYLHIVALAASALLASVCEAVIRGTQLNGASAFSLPPFVPIFGLLLGASLFWEAQVFRPGLFGRAINWQAHGYDAVRRFGKAMAAQPDLLGWAEILPDKLCSELRLDRAALWTWDEANARFTLLSRAGEWSEALPATLMAPQRALQHLAPAVRLSSHAATAAGWLAPLLRLRGAEVVVGLWLREPDTPLGLLVLGKRADEEVFDERDLELLGLVGQQCALLVSAARQLGEREQLYAWARETRESERQRLARELHDTTQQFLGGLSFRLATIAQLILHHPADAKPILAVCQEETARADDQLRRIVRDMAAAEVPGELAAPLTAYAAKLERRTGVTIELDLPVAAGHALPLDKRLALYRAACQSLDNASEHAQAQRIKLVLIEEGQRLVFVVSDDGRGFAADNPFPHDDGSHFGLRFMRDRLREVGGGLVVQSLPGAGTRVEGWVPAPIPLRDIL